MFNCYYRQNGTQTMPQTQYPTGVMTPMYQTGQMMPTYPLAPIGTTLPTGMPAGPAPAGTVATPMLAEAPDVQGMPTTVESVQYTPGFLRTQIGRKVRVEFLIGNGALVDRSGTLVAVGASYIVIRPLETDDLMLCDLYSIKFVTFFY